jgi:glycosyltransferase involved in cell wall biosynthesis
VKIAYVAWVPGAAETGVLKKIVFQLRAWRDAGHEVALFTLGHGAEPWPGASDLAFKVYPVSTATSWFRQADRLVDDVLALAPDVVYHRFNVYFPALEPLFARTRTVVELNTLDVPEYRASMSAPRFGYHLLTRGRILRGASGFVAVTDEIARKITRSRRPTLVLGNGIEMAAVAPLPPAHGPRTSLVLIAAKPDEAWHGVDKLFALARALPQLDLHVIGAFAAEPAAVPANVYLHGFLQQAEYRSVLASADVGVGPLALHRKHMDEACPLKTREYLALGLPIIAGYRDPDLRGVPHLLELPNQEDNVAQAVASIAEFAERWRHRRVERALVAHIDTRVKERVRLDFLAACARR